MLAHITYPQIASRLSKDVELIHLQRGEISTDVGTSHTALDSKPERLTLRLLEISRTIIFRNTAKQNKHT